jgi:hypothetical protein
MRDRIDNGAFYVGAIMWSALFVINGSAVAFFVSLLMAWWLGKHLIETRRWT